MSVWKSYRNYDISVWTLQDDYISTLKSGDPIVLKDTNANEPLQLQSISSDNDWPQTRLQGQIQNGSMTLNVDGTMQLSFDIPMYLFINGQRMENPNWYNTINDNILVSMRKIKVIFNKFQTIREFNQEKELTNSVFEFIIMKVQETHENDNLICHIECEGLAFHELGKVGYKRSLTTDEFINEYYEWSIKEVGKGGEYSSQAQKDEDKPINNLQYWMTKAKIDPKPVMDLTNYNVYTEWYAENINPNKWYYEIRMAHTSLVHEQEIPSNQIWEEGFPTDWTDSGDPLNYMEAREKTRLVDINESNLYNITQDLAEKFEVFCKYEYAYDYNYNIIGRTIVFYNNFLKEDDGVETLMYPSSASKISREMDSTNISTKMFIRSVENADLYAGYVNIMDCTANKSREDYLMNFDYLHDIGTISEEQYKEIPKYELKMKELNEQITPLQNAWSNLSELKTTVDAKVTTLTNSIELDEERITENQALIYAIDAADGDADGFITRDYRNPETLTLMKDSSDSNYDTYYVQFNQSDQTRGVQPETLELYKTYNTTSIKTNQYAVAYSAIGQKAIGNWNNNDTETRIKLPTGISWRNYKLEYKATIGKKADKPDTKVLPDEPKLGWIYYALSDNHPSGYNNKKGDLFICTNAENKTWEILSAPENYEEKKGFFIYEQTLTKQMSGPTTEIVTCSRKHSTSASQYVSKIRRLYYATTGVAAPSIPTDESAVTEETTIENKNVFDKWTSVMPVPEDLSTLSNYTYYTTWEIVMSSTTKKYTDRHDYAGNVIKDAADTPTTIENSATNAPEHFLQDKVEQGTYVYDEYGNLDQVNGLFKSAKSGSYFYYKFLKKADRYLVSNYQNYDTINTLTTALQSSVTDATMPSGKADNYVIVKQRQHCTNGNVIYLYRFKYYDDNEVFTIPNSGSSIIKEITPIFYLQTNSTLPPQPNNSNALTVVNVKQNNVWTTVLPDKTKSSQKYYSGWCIVPYEGSSKYYVPVENGNVVEDTSLKKVKPTNVEDEDAIPKYLYAIYKYKPSLYYEEIINSWIQKKYEDSVALEEAMERQAALEKLIDKIKTQIDALIEEKNTIIAKFEYMMGAALRESYWQPEDEYQNYGSRYEETLKLFFDHMYGNNHSGTFIFNRTEQHAAKFGWDSILLKEEDKLYYESSINQTKVYYPCIDLQALTQNAWDNPNTDDVPFLQKYYQWAAAGAKTEPFAFFFNPTKNELDLGIIAEHTGEQQNQYDIRYNQYYTIGSRAKLAFVRVKNTQDPHLSTVKPVLVLTDTSGLSDPELQNMYENGAVGQLIIEEQDGNFILTLKKSKTFYVSKQLTNAWMNVHKSNGKWVQNSHMENYEIVYPRIIVPSLKMKNNDKDLVLQMNNNNLTVYEDYYVFVKSYYNHTLFNDEDRDITIDNVLYKRDRYIDLENISNEQLEKVKNIDNAYAITIKPEYLFNHFNLINTSIPISLKLYYAISNADLSIYLDGKKILKENAYPKVAYDIEVSRWSPKLLNQLHTKLAQIVMINDVDLKFENTFGYISEVKLDLDHEEKDTVEVKNYKTKFEDLFSKIVAETEEMHKNSYNIGAAGALVSGGSVDVTLNSDGFADTLADPTNQEILQDFLNNYFDGPNVVQQTLQDMWNEAGQILASAATSLNAVMSATTQNASILAGFRENVAAALTPNIYTGATQPTTFKPGDIWYNPDNETYAVATGYSGRGGFTRTHDGALAQITGASMDIDADTGKIDILAETQINLMSGKNVYIAAGDTVDIVGNKAVNIGGTTINMASMNIIGGDYQGEVGGGGIHLVATDYKYNSTTEELDESEEDGHISRVDVTGLGIELASKNGIIIKSGGGIDIKSSSNEDVSAISINKEQGIFIGSNKGITMYAGTAANYYYGPETPEVIYAGDYWIQTVWKEWTNVTNSENIEFASTMRNGVKYFTNIQNGQSVLQALNYYYLNKGENNFILGYYIAVKNDDGTISWQSIRREDVNISGATVMLNQEMLILGMANIGQAAATAITMDTEEIVLAAGNELHKIKLSNGNVTDFTNANLSGLQIKKDYIGMAVGNVSNRSLLSLAPTKVMLGTVNQDSQYIVLEVGKNWNTVTNRDTSKIYLIPENETGDYYTKYVYKNQNWNQYTHVGPELYTGSYLWLGQEEIYIGSMGHFTLNTNNVKLQTKYLATTAGTNIVSSGNPVQMGFALGQYLQGKDSQGNNQKPIVGLGFWLDLDHKPHLMVDGDITAQVLMANGGVNAQGYGPFFRVDGTYMGIFKYSQGHTTLADAEKLFWFDSATGDLWITGYLHTAGIHIVDNDSTTSWNNYWSAPDTSYANAVNDLLGEAADILSAAANSLTDVQALNSNNYNMLASFYQNVAENLTPNTAKGPYHEWKFKTGDIWEKTNVSGNQSNLDNNGRQVSRQTNPYASLTTLATYIAMEDWDKIYHKTVNGVEVGDEAAAAAGQASTNGWNRTANGTLADIKGASIEIDSEAGTINIKAESSISLLAKAMIDLSSNDIEITGRRSVKMGGASIEIGTTPLINSINDTLTAQELAALYSEENAYTGHMYLVNSWREQIDNQWVYGTNKIMMDATGIEIAAKKGIVIKSGDGIEVFTSDNTNDHTHAIRINRKDGVYIGSGSAINLSASDSEVKGSLFSMKPDRILIGVTDENTNIGQNTTAIDLTSTQIILAAGTSGKNGPKFTDFNANIETLPISGVQIKSDYIGMATGEGASRSLISMSPSKILIGIGTISNGVPSGSYIKIENDTSVQNNPHSKFEIGGTGIFKVLTGATVEIMSSNLEIRSNPTSVQNYFYVGGVGNSASYIKYTGNNILEVRGIIKATSFILDGATISYNDLINKPSAEDFMLDGLSNNYRRIAAKDDAGITITLEQDINFNEIPMFKQNDTYTTGALVKSNDSPYNIYRLRDGSPAGTNWSSTTGKFLWYRRTVELTSTSALALGANAGVYILRKSNSTLDSTLDTALAINSNGIALDFYNGNNIIADSYIHLNSTGISMSGANIDMSGSHIYINGQQEWSRDDIVVMNSNASGDNEWKKSVEFIEDYMLYGKVKINNSTTLYRSPGHEASGSNSEVLTPITNDWVLIRPYYDLLVIFYSSQTQTNANSSNVLTCTRTKGVSIGDNADSFEYKLTFDLSWGADPTAVDSTTTMSFKLHLKNSSNREIIINCSFSNIHKRTYSTVTKTVTGLNGAINNLAQEDTSITVWYTDASHTPVSIRNLTIECSAAGTENTRVPCTVYYYPEGASTNYSPQTFNQ